VDPAMPLRLLGYLTEILTHHHQTQGLPLPPVIPFVFHQGPETWQVSTSFEDLFALPSESAADLLVYLPKFHHALLDLSRYDPATEESDPQLRMVLQLMKLARQRQLLRFFEWLCQMMADQVPARLFESMLVYALHADNELDVREIYDSLEANRELKKQAMSIAEKLKAEGRQEGRQEGRSEGLWIGRIQSLEEFLDLPQTPLSDLEALTMEALQTRYLHLHQDYNARFKGR
jgi:predicted transposase/invertase (TIGR01784 family)